MNLFKLEIKKYRPMKDFYHILALWLNNNSIDILLDIGANKGQYVKKLRDKKYYGKILSFEPLKKEYEVLLKNSIHDTNWDIAPRAAIGEYDGEAIINVASNSVSSSILEMLSTHLKSSPNSQFISKEKVKILSLDTVFNKLISINTNNVFVKIDVQGYEYKVLKGIKKNINKIKGIQVELSTIALYEDQKLYYEIIEYIRELGFNLFTINRGFTDQKTGKLLQFEGIFVR